MLGKFCVFCGEVPKSKNREHIIPKWLIELTGKPTRSVQLGIDWRRTKLDGNIFRRFSYSSFTFPACEDCNSHFSALEGRARQIIVDMLAWREVGAKDLDTLMDWLDKIRVGLWLGLMYLNGNFHGLRPMFYIKQRMAAHDRMVVIYRDDDPQQGVMFAAADSPIFHVMPSCILLVINQLHLFNASSAFLFAPRLGFPNQTARVLVKNGAGEYRAELLPGTHRLELPLVPYSIWPGGSQLYQPVVPQLVKSVGGDVLELYENNYVKDRCFDFNSGRGKVFQLTSGTLQEYPLTPSRDWVPPLAIPKSILLDALPIQAMDWLKKLLGESAHDFDEDANEFGEFVLMQRQQCAEMHDRMVEVQKGSSRGDKRRS